MIKKSNSLLCQYDRYSNNCLPLGITHGNCPFVMKVEHRCDLQTQANCKKERLPKVLEVNIEGIWEVEAEDRLG